MTKIHSSQIKQPIITDATTSRTLGLIDAGGILLMTSDSPVTITIPPDLTANLPTGVPIFVIQKGNGAITSIGGSGVTLVGSLFSTTIVGSAIVLIKSAPNVWDVLSGAMSELSVYEKFFEDYSPTGAVWFADGEAYQDISSTTPAGDGDPVEVIVQHVGSFNMAAPESGADPDTNPILVQDVSGKWYIQFDGAKNALVAGVAGSWNFLHNNTEDAYAIMALRPSASAADPNNYQGMFGTSAGSFTSTGLVVYYDDRVANSRQDGCIVYISDGTSNPAPLVSYTGDDSLEAQTDVVFELIKEANTVKAYINGLEVSNEIVSGLVSSNSAFALRMGDVGGGSAANSLEGNIYGFMVVDHIPSEQEREYFQNDMAERCLTPPVMA